MSEKQPLNSSSQQAQAQLDGSMLKGTQLPAESGANPTDLSQVMQASLYHSQPEGFNAALAGYSSGGGGLTVFDWLFDSGAARTHRDVMNTIDRTVTEVHHGMTGISSIVVDFAANSMENERTFEQLIQQYGNSAMVRASAPLYIQMARQMQLQGLPTVAQAGINRIKSKIERR
jgi:hypothetical protein